MTHRARVRHRGRPSAAAGCVRTRRRFQTHPPGPDRARHERPPGEGRPL